MIVTPKPYEQRPTRKLGRVEAHEQGPVSERRATTPEIEPEIESGVPSRPTEPWPPPIDPEPAPAEEIEDDRVPTLRPPP